MHVIAMCNRFLTCIRTCMETRRNFEVSKSKFHSRPAIWGQRYVVQDNISWTVGFGIPAAAMAVAMLLFVAGSRYYTHVEPTER